MSYGQTPADYDSGYQQYSESDILDFITHGNGDFAQNGEPFGPLDGAEDMVFGTFNTLGTSQDTFNPQALTISTELQPNFAMGTSQSIPVTQAPATENRAMPAISANIVGFSSFKDFNARKAKQDPPSYPQTPITPLRDTPHTPTNDMKPATTRSHLPMTSQPVNSTTSMFGSTPSANGMSASGANVAPEEDATELREFVGVGSQESDPLLDSTSESIQVMQKQIDEMRETQTQALQALSQNLVSEEEDNLKYAQNLEQMISYQSECLDLARGLADQLTQNLRQNVLAAHEVERTNTLNDELGFIIATLAVLQQELMAYAAWLKDGSQTPLLSQLIGLVIARSPFPSIWMKRNQMHEAEAITVRLILGCSVTLTHVSDMKAIMHCHTAYTAKTTAPKPIIDYDLFPCDPTTLTANIHFTFTGGSRKDVAQCRFAITVQGTSFATSVLINRGVEGVPQSESVELVSADSKPFIVITNECQYGETFGILFQKDVYNYQWGNEAQAGVPWPLFANSIQRYFIRSSRQDPANPKRGLSTYDMAHIHATFFDSQPLVDVKGFSKFWDWFGKVLHRMRYQRHVAAIWAEGLISGMISREGVVAQLMTRPPGTFLLRFSESSAGFIAVGYRVSGANAGIKNYLVKQEDTTTGVIKTLPDFIKNRPEFSVILQYTGKHLADGFPLLFPIHKDYALSAYCAPRPVKVADPKANGSPYDEL